MTDQTREIEKLSVLPEGYTMRSPVMDDLHAVASMINGASQLIDGHDEFAERLMRHEWQIEAWDLNRYARVVESPAGEIVAYAEVWNIATPKVRPFMYGRVHPHHRGRGIGTAMLEWAEALLRAEIDRAPEGAQVEMLASANRRHTDSIQTLTNVGMSITRYFWRMEIEMDGPPPAPVLPEGFMIRSLRPGESEREVYRAVREAFRDHWGFVDGGFEEAYARWEMFNIKIDDYDPSLRFIAFDGEVIAGGNLCMPTAFDDPDMGWVGTLGVTREYRGMGIGRALLLHSFGEFYRQGKRKVGLGVDAASLTGATRLYESVGMRAAREYANFSKVLREGVDISTQSTE